jgi:hypothetical protein
MPLAADFVRVCLSQRGDRYVFGAEVSLQDPDPDKFDCSELVQWACARVGVHPPFPDGSQWQQRHCMAHNTMIKVSEAKGIQGALLFRHLQGLDGADGHVAVSLGNGSTIEAMGTAFGVTKGTVAGRKWTAAALIPGLAYGAAVTPGPVIQEIPGGVAPPWPGRFLMRPPPMKGPDVRRWQAQMKKRGWPVKVTGTYDAKTEAACRKFQEEKGLLVDGVVGEDTWRAAWLAPVTP